jgi:hypothetical protein
MLGFIALLSLLSVSFEDTVFLSSGCSNMASFWKQREVLTSNQIYCPFDLRLGRLQNSEKHFSTVDSACEID